MAGRWEVGEDAGLEDLVESVKLHLARREGRTEITLWCVPPNAWKSKESDQPDFADIDETPEEQEKMMSRAFRVEAQSGLTITDVAKFGDGEGADNLGEYLECACAGISACSTCHVIIDPKWYDKVGEPTEDEQDMLDLAYAPRRTSRLGCQIELQENMDGMILRIPGSANNLMDHVPFG
jgi:2Fe-2S ferredoxin